MNWFAGSTFNIWWKFLKENKSILTPNNWFKALLVSIFTARNSKLLKKELILLESKNINAVKIKDPIFILGHWRSGTTHLHNILINDNAFNYPTLFQVTFPNTYLTMQKKIRAERISRSNKRPMDNMKISPLSPGEEEVAVWTMSSISSIGNRLLQNKETYYDKFMAFEDATEAEFLKWKSSFIYFLKKISYNDERQLLLKSPESTARIKILLKIFPNAKFINIHRNPYDIFQSTKHLYNKVIKPSYFHKVTETHLIDRIFLVYKNMYNSYFREIDLIPKDNFVDISYEELVSNPNSTIEKIYSELNLEFSESTRELMVSYQNSTKDYKKNKFNDLDPKLKERIYSEWKQNFLKWNYAQ